MSWVVKRAFSTKPRFIRTFPSLLKSLEIYNQIYGHSKVPQSFVVPKNDAQWPLELAEIPLGKRISQAREYKRDQALSPYQIEKLNQLGMIWHVTQYIEFQPVLEALKTFKSLYGHLRISTKKDFIVPSQAPWPEFMWTKSLTQRVLQFRRRRHALPAFQVQELTKIGFLFHVFEAEHAEREYPALALYKELYGDLNVPVLFVVPDDDPLWPQTMHGLQLGLVVRRLRATLLSKEQQKNLDELGMIWNLQEYEFESLILPALRAYHALHGHLFIRKGFVVPIENRSFPSATWGMKLGQIMLSLRLQTKAKKQTKKHFEELKQMGFEYEVSTLSKSNNMSEEELDELKLGLKMYQAIYGHTAIPNGFNAATAEGWPDRDLKLGKLIKKARLLYESKALNDDMVQTLSKLGMVWKYSPLKCIAIPALQTYKELYGTADVPTSFQVPHTEPWPKASWGKRIGRSLAKLRENVKTVVDEEDRKVLDELGWSWELKNSRRWRTLVFPALVQYAKLYNTTVIPDTYKIPPTDDWHTDLHGLWLGKTLYKIRRGICYHREVPEADRKTLISLGYKL